MPRPSLGRGFFKLDRNGDRVTEPSNVDPFDTLVTVVFIDIKLPWPFVLPTVYGRADESVTEIADAPIKKKQKNERMCGHSPINYFLLFDDAIISSYEMW